jgi:hypothetical protein
VRPIEQRLADSRDAIVENIAYQLSAFRPCGSTALGPAEITARIATFVDAFVEALGARRIAPFVDSLRAAADRPGERLAPAELHTVLDLLEDAAVRSVAESPDPARNQVDAAIRSLIEAGREAVPRDSRLEEK